MFIPSDLYLASGTGQLINNWVDTVYKFDSSSFYNWEQDNLPLYDLEDRGDLLHEMAGWPATVAPSVMLTVSDCGVDNKKVFGSVSAAIDALPNTIRQPVIIEVCVSGQLGELNLENKVCTGSDAGIEIINRGFAKMMCGSTTSPSCGPLSTENGANTAGSAILAVTSVDTSNTMTDTFSVGLSGVPIGSKTSVYDFWDSAVRSFVIVPEWSKAKPISKRTVSLT